MEAYVEKKFVADFVHYVMCLKMTIDEM